ncbi:MAG TPA: heme NO-binding domain-containing protein [Hydrogenophaga sp.]|uniref:heme NO-binding domain-containing protein n=1 Tax=Hydrogenophaga sp. TaxID=1904254 RepID=UPI002CD756D0|nr:heme NO-binding domain-containing protein [Hydrogenophaga sp.]HMN94627.1 heme NO-binding domain-containing protein [Hydrogenophaga sp.]HMP09717.1 heme NO-binding domain-containing protein [Hydrogenophaga sp.]
MKGVVFTEFLGMVEEAFSAEMVDDIIDDADPPSGGAYTAVGTYPHDEMVAMVVALSRRTGIAVPDLVRAFGKHLFGRFVQAYPSFFDGVDSTFQFLSGIEDIIHAEVLKLYPDAELPRFDIEHHDPRRLTLLYRSPRHFEDLAEGLMLGCIDHFKERIVLRREASSGDGGQRFHLERHV